MILIVAATEMELRPLFKDTDLPGDNWLSLVCGAGPVEAAVRLGSYLTKTGQQIDCVCNLGVGGAYIPPLPEKPMELLSVCLAEQEVFGDYGICHGAEMELLPEELSGPTCFDLRNSYLEKTKNILQQKGIRYYSGPFVTVNGASGTLERGSFLRYAWNGMCENMEGAALARTCLEYEVPFLEIRVISNLVEDRDLLKWRMQEACGRLGKIGALLLQEFV